VSKGGGRRLFEAWADATARSVPELAHARIRQRLLRAHAKTHTPRRALRYGLSLLAASMAVAVLAALLWGRPGATSFHVAGKSGQVGAWLTAEAARELPVRFSEGTQVALTAGSRGRVSRVSSAGAHIELERGSVSANVTHRPGADWTFSAGPFEISVLGTKLDVSWSPETGKFELVVTNGRVLLRGPLVPDAQEVRAGQLCRIDLTRRLLELGVVDAARAANAAPPVAAPPAAQPAPSQSQREPETFVPEPDASAVSPSTSPQALLELAAAARQTGRPEVERAALLECRKRAPGQPAAAQAAFLLGRASAGAEAARWFETYLREQPAGLLAREASGRLIESHVAARNGAAAAQAAARYLAAYPHGPHASMARRTLSARGSESRD
jgi:transmembrane sensor